MERQTNKRNEEFIEERTYGPRRIKGHPRNNNQNYFYGGDSRNINYDNNPNNTWSGETRREQTEIPGSANDSMGGGKMHEATGNFHNLEMKSKSNNNHHNHNNHHNNIRFNNNLRRWNTENNFNNRRQQKGGNFHGEYRYGDTTNQFGRNKDYRNQGFQNSIPKVGYQKKQSSNNNFHDHDHNSSPQNKKNDDMCDDIPKETLYADLDFRMLEYNDERTMNSKQEHVSHEEPPMAYNDMEYWKHN